MQNIRNMIHLLEMQNEDTKFFYLTKLSLCLKTNLSMGKKNLFLLKFIFLTPFFFLQNHFMLVHFQENDTYIIL